MSDHYNWTYRGIRLDPYRLELTCGPWRPAQAHAIKKLMRAGKGTKTYAQDIEESILSLRRELDMLREDQQDRSTGLEEVFQTGILLPKLK